MSAPEPRADFSSLLLLAPALQSCLVSQIFFMSLSFSLRINSVVFCLVYMVTKIKTLTVDEAGFRFSLTVYWQSGLPRGEEGGRRVGRRGLVNLFCLFCCSPQVGALIPEGTFVVFITGRNIAGCCGYLASPQLGGECC